MIQIGPGMFSGRKRREEGRNGRRNDAIEKANENGSKRKGGRGEGMKSNRKKEKREKEKRKQRKQKKKGTKRR